MYLYERDRYMTGFQANGLWSLSKMAAREGRFLVFNLGSLYWVCIVMQSFGKLGVAVMKKKGVNKKVQIKIKGKSQQKTKSAKSQIHKEGITNTGA